MLTYKYPWPSMLKCDQFPEDHDLCIRPGAANTEEKIGNLIIYGMILSFV